eukprot:402385_1
MKWRFILGIFLVVALMLGAHADSTADEQFDDSFDDFLDDSLGDSESVAEPLVAIAQCDPNCGGNAKCGFTSGPDDLLATTACLCKANGERETVTQETDGTKRYSCPYATCDG